MNLTGSHVAGGSFGAIVAVVLAALGKKIGLTLTDAEAAGGAFALLAVGVGVGHGVRELYDLGITTFFRNLWHGAKAK